MIVTITKTTNPGKQSSVEVSHTIDTEELQTEMAPTEVTDDIIIDTVLDHVYELMGSGTIDLAVEATIVIERHS